jgi:hypothetical protein
VGPDIASWGVTGVFLDTEGDVSRASVMLKARRCRRCGLSSCSMALCLLQVRGASSIRYLAGSTTSFLTSALTFSALYTQPFGSDVRTDPEARRDDFSDFLAIVVGRWNQRGIFVVFKGVEEPSCQRCGLRTIEVKPRVMLL